MGYFFHYIINSSRTAQRKQIECPQSVIFKAAPVCWIKKKSFSFWCHRFLLSIGTQPTFKGDRDIWKCDEFIFFTSQLLLYRKLFLNLSFLAALKMSSLNPHTVTKWATMQTMSTSQVSAEKPFNWNRSAALCEQQADKFSKCQICPLTSSDVVVSHIEVFICTTIGIKTANLCLILI